MRTLILAALIFFSLAPAALAWTPAGSYCTFNSECQSNICTSHVCQPAPAATSPSTQQPAAQPASQSSGFANGVGCSSNGDCASNYCDVWAGTCQPASGIQPSSSGVQSPGGTAGSSGVQSPGGTADTQSSPEVKLINPLKSGTSLESFLANILAFVVRIGSIVVILMLVYVGFLFVTARGEPGKITTARTALLWTVVGALVLLGAQAIALGIESTVNALSGG